MAKGCRTKLISYKVRFWRIQKKEENNRGNYFILKNQLTNKDTVFYTEDML